MSQKSEITNDLAIELYLHCSLCLAESKPQR